MKGLLFNHYHQLQTTDISLITRPFSPPVFDFLLCTNTEGEGLGDGKMHPEY